MSLNEYGNDTFVYTDHQRYLVQTVRTHLPVPGESNQAFEERMEDLVQMIGSAQRVRQVTSRYERRGGSIVSCLLTIDCEPTPAPISRDVRPAGGRQSERGRRAAAFSPA